MGWTSRSPAANSCGQESERRLQLVAALGRTRRLRGWHDGYMRLADPVMHRRRITFDKLARRVVIEDSLQMAATHGIELFFHCADRCRVDPAQAATR